jgi:hypothetical protein
MIPIISQLSLDKNYSLILDIMKNADYWLESFKSLAQRLAIAWASEAGFRCFINYPSWVATLSIKFR